MKISALKIFACVSLFVGPVRAENLAVQGEIIHTMAGAAIRDGVVLIKDGKIASVGPAAGVKIPEGFRVLKAKVVTPGLIDAHSVVGLSGILNQPQDDTPPIIAHHQSFTRKGWKTRC